MTKDDSFCDYCRVIDFGLLAHPTNSDISQVEAGGSGFQQPDLTKNFDDSSNETWGWTLGLQSRIDTSSSSCPLCRAVCELLRQNPRVREYRHHDGTLLDDCVCVVKVEMAAQIRPSTGDGRYQGEVRCMSLYWQERDNRNVEPGIVEHAEIDPRMPILVNCFQSCIPDVDHHSPVRDVFSRQATNPGEIACGGRLRPEMLNPELPAAWLSNCVGTHGDRCSLPSDLAHVERQVGLFRLIDVHTASIKEFRDATLSSLKYAALTYVWGRVQLLTLQRSNLEDLQKPGSLQSALVAHTVRDAITFTKSLGLSYVWVDALCIVQDDEEDVASQIAIMGDIYLHALLSIAAATGFNANAGLPGVGTPRTAQQVEVPLPMTEKGSPKSLLTTLSPRRHFYIGVAEYSVWNTRAWTMQEYVLSRRLVLFLEQQIVWQCGQASWAEETHAEALPIRLTWTWAMYNPMLNNFDEDMGLEQVYMLVVRSLNTRTLTYPGDAHDAVSGILGEIQRRTGDTYLWGMATSDFERSLCWRPLRDYPPERRLCLTTRKATYARRQVPFPSWTWLGWYGHNAGVGGHTTAEYVEQIACFVLRNQPLRLERVSSRDIAQGHVALTLDHVAAASGLSFVELENVPDDQYLCFWAECISFNNAEAVELSDIDGVPEGTKFFRTEDASFMVSELYPDECNSNIAEMILGPSPEKWSRAIVDVADHAVVGSTEPSRSKEVDGESIELVLMAYDDDDNVVIMEVHRQNGIVYRRSIGFVERSLWSKSRPSSKVVIMN